MLPGSASSGDEPVALQVGTVGMQHDAPIFSMPHEKLKIFGWCSKLHLANLDCQNMCSCFSKICVHAFRTANEDATD